MIINYHEESETVEIHSNVHTVCTHDVENGWECSCSDCRCDTIVAVQSHYSYDADRDHKVMITLNPGQYHGKGVGALTPNAARALAAALCFAAHDAETLNREFPND